METHTTRILRALMAEMEHDMAEAEDLTEMGAAARRWQSLMAERKRKQKMAEEKEDG